MAGPNQDAEDKYEVLFENFSQGFIVFDLKGTILHANEKAILLLNRQKDDVVGKSFQEMIKEKNIPNFEKTIQGMIDQEQVKRIDYYELKNYKRTVLLELYFIPYMEKGSIKQIIALPNLATDSKKAQQDLIVSEEWYFTLFNLSPFAIIIIDLEGIIIDVNTTIEKLLGYTREEFIGSNFIDIPVYNPEFLNIFKERLMLYASGKKLRSIFINLYRKDGTIVKANPKVSLITISGNKYLQILFEDISAKKKLERKLKLSEKKYREIFESNNLYKDLFAHDMKNVLQNLLSSLEFFSFTLDKSDDLASKKALITECKKQIIKGANLVKIVKKYPNLKPLKSLSNTISINHCLDTAIELATKHSIEKRIHINYDIKSDEDQVIGNELITQIFENILLNAIFNNENDVIEIEIKSYHLIEDDKKVLRVEFNDNGREIFGLNKKPSLDIEGSIDKGIGLEVYLINGILETCGASINRADCHAERKRRLNKIIIDFLQD